MSPKGKTWNYPFGSIYLRLTKSGKDRWYIYYRNEGRRVRKAVKGAQSQGRCPKSPSGGGCGCLQGHAWLPESRGETATVR